MRERGHRLPQRSYPTHPLAGVQRLELLRVPLEAHGLRGQRSHMRRARRLRHLSQKALDWPLERQKETDWMPHSLSIQEGQQPLSLGALFEELACLSHTARHDPARGTIVFSS